MVSVWDFLFPKRCLGCGEAGEYVCSECLNKLQPLKEQVCPMCGRVSGMGRVHPACMKPEGMVGLMSVFPYRGLAKKLVTKFKYMFVSDLLVVMAELMASDGDWRLLEREQWLVMGVPLHPARERWRGFNQANKLGAAMAGQMGWRYAEKVLVRLNNTKAQMTLKSTGRSENVVGAFGVGEGVEAVRNRAVLLVDDVWTTGATMRECAKVLKKAGVKRVYGLTFARSMGEKQ